MAVAAQDQARRLHMAIAARAVRRVQYDIPVQDPGQGFIALDQFQDRRQVMQVIILDKIDDILAVGLAIAEIRPHRGAVAGHVQGHQPGWAGGAGKNLRRPAEAFPV